MVDDIETSQNPSQHSDSVMQPGGCGSVPDIKHILVAPHGNNSEFEHLSWSSPCWHCQCAASADEDDAASEDVHREDGSHERCSANLSENCCAPMDLT